LRVPTDMHAGDHYHALVVNAIEESVGEPAEKGTPGVAMEDSMRTGVRSDASKRCVDGR